MKQSEINNYGISNPDGFDEQRFGSKKERYENDDPHAVKENALQDQKENARVAETFDDPKGVKNDEQRGGNMEMELSSSASSASSAASSTAASASVGGGLGALAGVVAASVVAAVIVVAVFVSTLTINLSLVFADMNSLVLEVVMTGAQEEDFEKPIYAVLTGEDGTYLEQEIDPERLTITFEGLEKGTEYLVVVKNEDKVFVERTFFTATEPVEKGYIVSHLEGTEVCVEVKETALNAGEYYTLVAKDAQGNIVFTKDGVEANTEYRFTVDEPQNLYFSLSVDGRTYAVTSIELPEYDFENGVWAWADNKLAATVTFTDKKGGEALVLDAAVTRKTTEATCEKDGSIVYTAKAAYNGKTYTQTQTVVLESEGHTYEGSYEGGVFTYTCSKCGDTYTDEE